MAECSYHHLIGPIKENTGMFLIKAEVENRLFNSTCRIMWEELPEGIFLLFPKIIEKTRAIWDRLQTSRSSEDVSAFQAAFVNMLAFGQQFFKWWATAGYTDNGQLMLAHEACEMWAELDPECPYNLDPQYNPKKEVVRMLGWRTYKADPLLDIARQEIPPEPLPAVQRL
jgi:hypothetical protein